MGSEMAVSALLQGTYHGVVVSSATRFPEPHAGGPCVPVQVLRVRLDGDGLTGRTVQVRHLAWREIGVGEAVRLQVACQAGHTYIDVMAC